MRTVARWVVALLVGLVVAALVALGLSLAVIFCRMAIQLLFLVARLWAESPLWARVVVCGAGSGAAVAVVVAAGPRKEDEQCST